ncbi:MAG: hypothetical protein ACI867_000910 [Glaciecola sp.]|jgi:hypothetical protein
MDHATALRELGVRPDTLTDAERGRLDSEGWLVWEDAFSAQEAKAMRDAIDRILDQQVTAGMENPGDSGSEMVFGITGRDIAFAPILLQPRVWAAAKHLFGDFPFYGGNENLRTPLPGNGLQSIHSDNPPVPLGAPWHTMQVVYAAGDITAEMGATRLIPGSQRNQKAAHEVLDDPVAVQSGQIQLVAPAGSVVVFNANCWHGGMTNLTTKRRYAVFGTMKRHEKFREHPRPTPPALASLPAAAKFLFGDNPWLDDPMQANPFTCWCCGIRRDCHSKGPVDVGALDQDAQGLRVIHDLSMATYGLAPTTIL